jgi:transcriptional regulator with XRE-family HTH domain
VSSTRTAVAANVRAEIARAGVQRRAVADAAGLSYEALHRRLHGRVAFDVDDLAAIARLLGIPMAQLLGAEVAA